MSKYRNDQIDEQMANIGLCLTGIEAKEADNLCVSDILAENRHDHPDMSFEKAVELGMRQNAKEALFRATVLATSFDRLVAMTEQMIEGIKGTSLAGAAERYEKRLGILLNLDKLSEELTPPQSIHTDNRAVRKTSEKHPDDI
jgi:hypothetical protein